MERIARLALIIFTLCIALTGNNVFAQSYGATETSGRYELVVFGKGSIYERAYTITKLPAVVLDTVMGIVWRCDNIESSSPRWVKTDLGKNVDITLSSKRYTIQIAYSQISGNKIPAIVLDIEEGRVWTCPNLLDEGVGWIQKDLVKEIKEQQRLGY